MSRFQVRKVAVLGAGVMSAQTAAHLVNMKVPVVLFDLPAKEGPKSGIVTKAIDNLKKLKPSPLGVADDASLIQAANYEAIPAALRFAGLKHEDIGWIELNEAFAAQSLAVINRLGLDPSKVNSMGGAIALGHPLGATGAIRAATVVQALHRHNLKYGMVTMCVGTGQGAAGIFERA